MFSDQDIVKLKSLKWLNRSFIFAGIVVFFGSSVYVINLCRQHLINSVNKDEIAKIFYAGTFAGIAFTFAGLVNLFVFRIIGKYLKNKQ